jgi:threonine/homoserine/homoserine lactone efflux protein
MFSLGVSPKWAAFMELHTFLIFATTTAVVIFSPGPTAVLMASQGAGNGFRPTLFGVLGVTCATMIYFVLSATGIASLIVASHTLFQIIKWAGVGYLIYLGLGAILRKSHGLIVSGNVPRRGPKALFAHGFLIEFSNPKALLYSAAILPQFFGYLAARGQTVFDHVGHRMSVTMGDIWQLCIVGCPVGTLRRERLGHQRNQ